MARISGFGQSGPYRGRAGYGVIGEAVSGLRHVTGDPDRPPTRAAVSLTDYFTGLYAAFGIVMAVLARQTTGKGQCIDAALYECAFSFMEPHIPAFEKLGHIASRAGSRLPDSTPNNLYPTGDGSYIHITAMGEAVFQRLMQTMKRPDLASDSRFATSRARSEHHEAIDAEISAWTLSLDLATLEKRLEVAGVPATRIYTMQDIFADPHFAARGMLAKVKDEQLGSVTMAGVVPKLSGTPGELRVSGGAVGRDTEHVLTSVAGLSAGEVADLIRKNVVYLAPHSTDCNPAHDPVSA